MADGIVSGSADPVVPSSPSFLTPGGTPSVRFDTLANPGEVVHPFANVTLVDPGTGAVETLTANVELFGATTGGPSGFSGPGFTAEGTSQFGTIYVATGTVAEINADLAAATFFDTIRQPGPSSPFLDTIALSDVGSVAGTSASTGTIYGGVTERTVEVAPPCFASGTLIRTEAGDVAVEDLRVGERVCTAAGGLRPVRWLGHRRVDCRRHPEPTKVQPVRVRAHAFGAGLPARDLVLSPEHALLLDGHLVPVHVLVDGISVVQEAWERVTYHHVELDRHDVLLAEGMATESYLDTGNRASFANGALVSLSADFDRGSEPAEACAPFALTGLVVETQRAKLQANALGQHWAAA